MPWTFAHPAAVLPLRRWCAGRLSFAGLVVGSCAPDFGYHLHRFDIATFAHTFVGLFVVCLPTAMLPAALLQRYGGALIQPLPPRHRHALAPLTTNAWPRGGRAWLTIAASVLLGALTHVVWDGFTHAGGWVVQQAAWLQRPLPGTEAPQAFRLLQHASSLIGTAALLVWYGRFLRGRAPAPLPADARARSMLLPALAVAAAIGGSAVANATTGPTGLSVWVVRSAIDGATLFLLLYLAAALVSARQCLRQRHAAPPEPPA